MAGRRCVETGCGERAVAGSERCRRHRAAFYVAALPADMRGIYERASALDGLDEEIALLRVLFQRAAVEHPDDPDLVQKGNLLIRAIVTRHRISRRAEQDLMDSLAGVIEGFGNLLEDPA